MLFKAIKNDGIYVHRETLEVFELLEKHSFDTDSSTGWVEFKTKEEAENHFKLRKNLVLNRVFVI